ncbi:MAG TPA: hypothetical protein VN456_03435 [Desulfosporosinus sp.]|nr:hypothetical protein [Desulfosporosinus sp.]
MSVDAKALRSATGLVHDSNRTFEVRARTLPKMAMRRNELHGRQGAAHIE